MRWHRQRKVKNGHIRHPADGEACKSLIKNIPTLHEILKMCILD
ncbi:unnamed protein product [Rhodiola kirilowii]